MGLCLSLRGLSLCLSMRLGLGGGLSLNMCLRVHLCLGLHILLIGLSSALTAYYDVLLVDDHDVLDLSTG